MLSMFYNFLVSGERFTCKLRKSYVNSSRSFGEVKPLYLQFVFNENPKVALNSFANHKTCRRTDWQGEETETETET